MTISFTITNGTESPNIYSDVMCFGNVSTRFAQPSNKTTETLEYKADIKKGTEELFRRLNKKDIEYNPQIFLKDIVSVDSPLKTALDLISKESGEICIDPENCSCVVTTKIMYKIALLPLSLVRYVEEQPSLVYSYLNKRELCDSPAQALLWAHLDHEARGEFTGHDVIYPFYTSVMSSSGKVNNVLKEQKKGIIMTEILGIPYKSSLYSKLADGFVRGPGVFKQKEDFISRQKKVLQLLKENGYDPNDYVTA